MVGTSTRNVTRERSDAEVFGWRRLGVAAGVVAFVGHLLVGAAIRDLDAVFIAVGFGVALGLLRVRRGTAGMVLLALSFANVAFWTTTGTLANIRGGATFLGIALPSAMAVLAVVGLIAVVATVLRRSDPDAGELGALLTAVAGALIAGAVLVGAALGSGPQPVPDDAVRITTDRTEFSVDELVLPSGSTTIAVENRDYFWHTFTVPALSLDIRVPVGATRVVTIDLPVGRYDYVCAIPGHDVAGMEGVLIVEPTP